MESKWEPTRVLHYCWMILLVSPLPQGLRLFRNSCITMSSQTTTSRRLQTDEDLLQDDEKRHRPGFFTETTAVNARLLTDGARLSPLISRNNSAKEGVQSSTSSSSPVILPWMGFGTYRLGKDQAKRATLQALEAGYRSIDTAFIYGGETTERLVGQAIQKAIEKGVLQSREQVFVTTKHWRKYHGYDPTLECLNLSLRRLQLDYVDLWLMHWPGPAWITMNRRKELVEEDRWHYATTPADQIVALRAETWRAMEDAYRKGLVRAIGVSNMTVTQLETLKRYSTLWPPPSTKSNCIHSTHRRETRVLPKGRNFGASIRKSWRTRCRGEKQCGNLLGVNVPRRETEAKSDAG